jgi:subtilisin family serine protease
MRRRLLVLAGLATFGLLGPALAPAVHADTTTTIDTGDDRKADPDPEVTESTTGSYIVVMIDDPLIATIDQGDLDTPVAEATAEEIRDDHDDVLEAAGVGTAEKIQDFTNALNGFAATLSHAQAVKVASDPNVAGVFPDELRQVTTDSSADFLGLTGRGRAYASGLDGEGVIVGVIDTGIWPEHPSFADDGTYPDPGIVLDDTVYPTCDFGNTAHHPDDAAFACNNKLIGARQMLSTYRAVIGADADEFDSARDDNGHGTHTASTAAGNTGVDAEILGKDYGAISGIAPRAGVIAYKGLGNLGGFTSDLTAAIDQAVADGVDVINYSIGGGPDLISPDALAYLYAADAGVWVATSAGNSGPGAETVGGPGDVPWITTVGANTQERFFQGTLTLRHGQSSGDAVESLTAAATATSTSGSLWSRNSHWWNWWRWWARTPSTRVHGASVTTELSARTPIVDAEFAGGDLCLRDTLDTAVVTGKVVLCRRGAIGRAEKGLAVFEAGGVGMVLYNNTDDDNLFTDTHWVPSVHIDNTHGLEVKQYINDESNPTATITNTGKRTKFKAAPSMAYFSSRGANVTSADIIKPDITAPGLQILAGGSPFPDIGAVAGELFQAISGTSMSSPHVAGFYALLKQAHPDWTPAMAKSAIMTTADPKVLDSDQTSLADPFARGAGHLRPGRVDKRGSAFNPGIVYDAGFDDYLAFLCDAAPDAFGDAAATCAALGAAGFSTDASDLNLASIGIGELAGSQTVTRTMTSVADTAIRLRAHVDAPAGYNVTVTPSVIELSPGESATYEVAFVNDGSAPAGEWRFGALTWKGNGYTAQSPIALRGTLIGTPSAVTGTGVDGSVTFDISFGYTGAYAAAAHGPVAPNVHADEISADPDQTYPSVDDGEGVDRIPITLTGAAIARWELVIPGPDDIDLFLEDAGGNVVASSTAGGTNEHIELVLPPDGDYTMVVHGWSVPSEPLAYDLNEWVVSATPGGAMTLDSAPTEAVTGSVGTIAASWTGLDPATRYLGAISHSDGTELLGLSLIEIDT